MKVVEHADKVELIPETDFERRAMGKIVGKSVTINWTDAWEQSGNIEIKPELHPWDR